MADDSVEALRGVYDKGTMLSGEDFEQMMDYVQEEIFADAYAGINAFGAGADRFTSAVNEKMEQLYLGRYRSQENGVRKTNGPPTTERYSHEGDNAEVEDSQTLGEEEQASSYEGRSLTEDSSIYSYDFLTNQCDMTVTMLPEVKEIRDTDGKINAADIVSEGMKNARAVGTERAGNIYVTNRYTGRELWVTAASVRHGLNGAMNRKLTKINTAELAEKGYDSVDLVIGGGSGKIYCVFDNTQIKSADPVTYDDDGNVIPLSERFNAELDDIRYSVDELYEEEYARQQARDDQGRQLSQGQAEYFKDSQARDENGNLATVYHSSPTAGFYQFDGRNGNGHYRFGKYGKTVTFFTDKKAMADTYTADNKRVDTTRNGRFKDGLQDLKRKVTGQPAPSYSGQYEGYTNITKPYVVDAEGRNWDDVRTVFDQEKYDSLMSITPEEKAAVMSLWEMAGQNQDWFCAICNMFDIRASRAQLKDTSQRHG